MRYDDPDRPKSDLGDNSPLQVSQSPLPVVTLIRPMESEGEVVWHCRGDAGDAGDGECAHNPSEDCPNCHRSSETKWGWLACIYAHRESNRFGYYTGWIGDLDEFHRAYLADPEAALAKWFKYLGPEEKREKRDGATIGATINSLWDDDDGGT